MKLLLDMNLSPRWVAELTGAGFEADHWTILGAPTTTNATIMALAQQHQYVVLTHDLDFGAIPAATHGNKPSVVQIRPENTSTSAIGELVIAALKQMARELQDGALMTVDASRVRLRLLPFHQQR